MFLFFFFFFNDTATTEIYTTRHTLPYTTLFRSLGERHGGDGKCQARSVRSAACGTQREPAREGGKERQVGAEREGRDRRERPRHRAVVVQAHVHPRHAGEKVAEPEREPRKRGLARRAALRPDVE